MSEPHEIRLRRLGMRSMRRGIREMDVILTRYAGARLDSLSTAQLDIYDALLEENDHDLYQWVSRQVPAPARYSAMIDDIAALPGTAQNSPM